MAAKKWITKREIADILKAYSVRADEFEPFGDEGLSFKNKYLRGYTLSIEQEFQYGNEKTGRVVVSHTRDGGKRTFLDIWQRDSEGKLQFEFRNPWDRPFTDYDYIKDLEAQINEFKEAGFRVITDQNIDEMFEEREYMLAQIGDGIDKLKNENQALQERVLYLEEENQKLINKTEHNARGAGRKADPQHLKEQVAKVQSLIEEGKSISDIQQIMGISRSSYFRYKKLIGNK